MGFPELGDVELSRSQPSASRNRGLYDARNLAVQMRNPTLVQLLTTSLGEEQNAARLLDQLAQPLLSVARMRPRSNKRRHGGTTGRRTGLSYGQAIRKGRTSLRDRRLESPA